MYADLLALATEAARGAGDLIRHRPPAMSHSTKSTPTDVVTEMDTAAERYLVKRLLDARPHDGVLGEEGAGVEGSSGVRWVIDPIDGTVNYLYGLPAYAVSVAAVRDDATLAGAVYDVARNEMYAAALGGGATRDGVALHCSPQAELRQALIATGFSYDAGNRAEQAAVLLRVLPQIRDIRRIGACALDLCAVAAGRLDGYYEHGPSEWDFAAGRLVVTEAGGRFVGRAGGLVAAAGPRLYDGLLELVERATTEERHRSSR